MTNLFKKLWRNEDGNFGVLGAIGTSAVLATTALAVDSSSLYNSKASIQSALDAATLAASYGSPGEYNTIATEVFDSAFGLDGLDNRTVTVVRNGDFLEGRANGTASAFFGGILMPAQVEIGAFTKVGFSREIGGNTEEEVGTRACIIALDEGSETFVTNSSAKIDAPGCEIHVASTRRSVVLNADGGLNIDKMCIASSRFRENNLDGRDRRNLNAEFNCNTASDPYAGTYAAADDSSCDYNNFLSDQQFRSRRSANVMQPGVYCGTTTLKSDAGDVEMAPGLYVFRGQFQVEGARVTGEGVTLYTARRWWRYEY